MLGQDVRTNFKQYYEDQSNTRVADLLDLPNWREEYRGSGTNIVRFVLAKFNDAMAGLGYKPARDDLVHQVKIARKNVFLYSLVLYSFHPKTRLSRVSAALNTRLARLSEPK